MQTAIAKAHTSILDLLHKEEFAEIVNNLPGMAVSPILAPLLQGMSEVDHHLYFNNVAVPNPPLWSSAPSPAIPVPPPSSDREDTPSTVVNPGTPAVRAASADSTSSLLSYQSVPARLPSPVTILFSFPHIPSISSLVLLFRTYSLLHRFSHTSPYSHFHHNSSSFFLFPF